MSGPAKPTTPVTVPSSQSPLQPAVRHGERYLRASYVWRDEVMDDHVFAEPTAVTLSTQQGATFTTADVGLPPNFVILRPGERGYVLTLGRGMTGRVSINGSEQNVADFVRTASDSGSFRAATVTPGDWGVIHLDGKENHSLFFQFVAAGPALPPRRWQDSDLLAPALAFAVAVHSVFLWVAFRFDDDKNAFVWPGGGDIVDDYRKVRPPPPDPPEKKKAVAAADSDTKKKVTKPVARKQKAGKSGGKGKVRRTRKDVAKGNDEAPSIPDTGLTSRRSREQLERLRNRAGIDTNLGSALALFDKKNKQGDRGRGPKAGWGVGPKGPGSGTRSDVSGTGRGGNGDSRNDVRTSRKPLRTGGNRSGGGSGNGPAEKTVKVVSGSPVFTGNLTRSEINRVVRSRRGRIKYCYQKQLNRIAGLGGKLTVSFRISPGGKVTSARVSGSLKNSAVRDCVARQIRGLKFPPKGPATVKYPFIFDS